MKKTISTMLALLLIVGCASNRSGSTEETGTDTPDWWFSPAASETHYYAFGQAKKQNPSLAQKIATQRARDDISQQVKSNVENEIRDWMQESGVGENAQALEFSENTSISTSENVLRGAVPDKYAREKDGTVYVRVSFLKAEIEKTILNAAKREEALYNEFKASQSFERLRMKVSD